MTLLKPGFLATSSLEVHQTAEEQWRRHGTTPVKVILFAADGVPHLVDFEQGIGQDAVGQAVSAHAARIGAVAVVLTAIAHVAEVEIDLTPSEANAGPQPDQAMSTARLVGDFGQAVVTLAIWPARDLTKALRSTILTSLDGSDVLLSAREGTTVDPADFAGLITWLTGLLPEAHAEGGVVTPDHHPAPDLEPAAPTPAPPPSTRTRSGRTSG